MNIHKLLVTFLSLTHLFDYPTWAIDCLAGDPGPKPLDITATLSKKLRAIPTAGAVEQFTFWEKSSLLVYRNEFNQLYDTHPDFGMPRYYGPLEEPLSRLVDPLERYLLIEGKHWIRDLTKPDGWIDFQAPDVPLKHLFWRNQSLYTAALINTHSGEQELHLFRYQYGSTSVTRVCKPKYFPAGASVLFAEGHAYPYAYFYQTYPAADGRYQLTVFTLDVRSDGLFCNWGNMEGVTWAVPSPVEGVHKFPNLGLKTIAIKLQNPEKHFWWSTGNHCEYIDIENLSPMVPNHRLPIAFTWSRSSGLTMFHLGHKKKATLLEGSDALRLITGLDGENLWLTSNADRLYFAPVTEFDEKRWVFELKLGLIK